MYYKKYLHTLDIFSSGPNLNKLSINYQFYLRFVALEEEEEEKKNKKKKQAQPQTRKKGDKMIRGKTDHFLFCWAITRNSLTALYNYNINCC